MGYGKLNKVHNQSDLHDEFSPAVIENRHRIECSIENNNVFIPITVQKLSPFGIEFYINIDIENLDKTKKIKLVINNQVTDLEGIFIHSYYIDDKNIYCFRFVSREKGTGIYNRRKSSRWYCSNQYTPTGIANSPAMLNDFVYFKIKDLSFGGMQLTCSLRNKILFPGITIQTLINFPMISQVQVSLKINSVNLMKEGEKEVLRIGASYDTSNDRLNEIIASYLIQFTPDASSDDMRKQKLLKSNNDMILSYEYVKNKKQLVQSLNLRTENDLKQPNEFYNSGLTDIYDVRSRIINGYYKDIPICTARVMYAQINDQLNLENFKSNIGLLPQKIDILEITNFYIKFDYFNKSVFFEFIEQIAVMASHSNRRYIAVLTESKYIDYFLKVGFVIIENKSDKTLLLLDTVSLVKEFKISSIIWNLCWGKLSNNILETKQVELTPEEKLKIKIYDILKPASWIYKKIYWPNFD